MMGKLTVTIHFFLLLSLFPIRMFAYLKESNRNKELKGIQIATPGEQCRIISEGGSPFMCNCWRYTKERHGEISRFAA